SFVRRSLGECQALHQTEPQSSSSEYWSASDRQRQSVSGISIRRRRVQPSKRRFVRQDRESVPSPCAPAQLRLPLIAKVLPPGRRLVLRLRLLFWHRFRFER